MRAASSPSAQVTEAQRPASPAPAGEKWANHVQFTLCLGVRWNEMLSNQLQTFTPAWHKLRLTSTWSTWWHAWMPTSPPSSTELMLWRLSRSRTTVRLGLQDRCTFQKDVGGINVQRASGHWSWRTAASTAVQNPRSVLLISFSTPEFGFLFSPINWLTPKAKHRMELETKVASLQVRPSPA